MEQIEMGEDHAIQMTKVNSSVFIDMLNDLVTSCSYVDEWFIKSFDELFNLYGGENFDCYAMTICNDMVTVIEKIRMDGEKEHLLHRSMFFPDSSFYAKYGSEVQESIEGLGLFGFARYVNFPSSEDLQKYDQFGALLSL